MIINQPNLESLRVTLDLSFREGYDQAPTFYDQLCTSRPSTSRANLYGWMAQQIKMREWIGPRLVLALSEREYKVENRKFEATIEVRREDIEDDEIDVYASQLFPDLGRAVRKFPDQLLREILQSNPVGFDGVTLFNGAHPTYDDAGTTYDNDFALALTADNFNTVWSEMASFTGEDGEPLAIMSNLLVVPPQLRKPALEITSAPLILQNGTGSAAPTNVLQGWAQVLVVPELANEPAVWYLADTSRSIRPFVWQERTADELVMRTNPEDPRVFEDDVFVWGARKRAEMAPTLPFLISRSDGS